MSDIWVLLGIDEEELDWQNLAMCRGMNREEFYDEYESNESVAKTTDQVCLSCPVFNDCLRFAIENNEQGVWGGVYLINGEVDPKRNKHKTKEVWQEWRRRVEG